MRAEIAEKVARFPAKPGVYIFLGQKGKTLYVGKAASLRARVRAYLKPGGDGRYQLPFLEREAVDVEFLVTRTEQEALLLENTIIKKRKPVYNIKLRDDKSYLMLRLDRSEVWPWFRLVRRRQSDGAEYFGPYASARSVRHTLRLLHKVVPLRDCSEGVFKHRSRACLKHQIGRCPAPCVGLIDHAGYDVLLDEAVAILRGGADGLLRRMEGDMALAAEALEFERAQAIKLQLMALQAVAERQLVVGSGEGAEDVFGLHRSQEELAVVVLFFRSGKLESSRRFLFPTVLPDELVLGDVLTRFYEGDRFVPPSLLVPGPVEGHEVIEDWLSQKRGSQVTIAQPQRGNRKRHLEMAEENARHAEAQASDELGRRAGAARRLGELLEIDVVPQRLHCIDVSTIQGRFTVASRVCFVDGRPAKAFYRRFEISEAAAGDDFSAMEEAVRRSLSLCLKDGEDELPDLLILDGGQGQLAAAGRAVEDLALTEELPLVGLAKSRLRGVGDERRESGERLFCVAREVPIPLPDGHATTLLVAGIRDEAHRFAITYHRKLRGRLGSEIDEIPGVGPSRRRALLRHFGSLSGLKEADLDALMKVPGVPEAVARKVFSALHSDPHP